MKAWEGLGKAGETEDMRASFFVIGRNGWLLAGCSCFLPILLLSWRLRCAVFPDLWGWVLCCFWCLFSGMVVLVCLTFACVMYWFSSRLFILVNVSVLSVASAFLGVSFWYILSDFVVVLVPLVCGCRVCVWRIWFLSWSVLELRG